MTDADARTFLREARVGRLATVDGHGRPSVVPFCFALLDGNEPIIASALDEKPKSVPDAELARVRHVRVHPDVAFVVDRYDEDWSQLAWVQVKGRARIVAPGEGRHAEAVAALREKYPQYRSMALDQRAVILIERLRLRSWSASEPANAGGA